MPRSSSDERARRRPNDARRWRSWLLPAMALALAFGARAQTPPKPQPPKIADFRTPDGSRFVLVPDESLRQVHWAIASWVDGRDDPRGLEGLALATVRTSLGGTWQIGGSDPDGERQAARELDEARRALRKQRDDAKLQQQVLVAELALATFGDLRTFRRVLAATPAHRPEVLEHGPTATFVVTTVADAIPDVAELLRARREESALRGLPTTWRALLAQRIADRKQDVSATLHAELLALLMPFASRARMLEWPREHAFPTFEQALACWQASQHPSNTVHVLVGNFDAATVREALRTTFATTALPTPADREPVHPRPPRTERRSIVHGYGTPRLAVAWTLPAQRPPWAAEVTARWFGDGERSWLGRRLRRLGYRDLELRCLAPWPQVESGRSMLLLEIHDLSRKEGLLDAVIEQCAAIASQRLEDGAFFVANMELQHEWNDRHSDPRAIAVTLARRALMYPREAPSIAAPPQVDAKTALSLLKATLGTKPAIVEGQR